MNCTRPQLAVIIEPIRKAFIDAKNRGVRLRYITEITRDNISACKRAYDYSRRSATFRGNKRKFYGK